MNIFVLNKDPWKCAAHYCDIHVNKMLIESCQMLCTALRLNGVDDDRLYKTTHVNHPCVKWVCKTKANFLWLNELAMALTCEYAKRNNKIHKCVEVLDVINNVDIPLIKAKLTPWPQVMPDEFKIHHLIYESPPLNEQYSLCIKAYRRYYAVKLWDFRKRGLLNRGKQCI